jgi:hypothetical protein
MNRYFPRRPHPGRLLARRLIVAAAVAGIACGNDEPAPEPVGTEPQQLAGFTAAHNAVRAGLGPLTWSNGLSHTAQALTDACLWVFDLDESNANRWSEYIYEPREVSPSDVVQAWAVDDAARTRLAQSGISRLGCGVTVCPVLKPFDPPEEGTYNLFWVCVYGSD